MITHNVRLSEYNQVKMFCFFNYYYFILNTGLNWILATQCLYTGKNHNIMAHDWFKIVCFNNILDKNQSILLWHDIDQLNIADNMFPNLQSLA